MVLWSDLSHCHNYRTATSALGILCVCGCYGVQHFDPGSAPSAAPPPSSSKAAPPASGPAQSAPKVPSFVETARLRKQRQTGQIYEQSFDPSSKIHVESWAKLAPRPEKRKHATGGSAKEGGIKRAATGSAISSGPTKLAPVVKFTFVLVEKPKMVDEGEYRMPDSGRMTSLYRCGHIRIIEFHPSATPKDIEAIVSDKYSSLPAIVEGKASMFNFVLLSKKPVSRGARPFLIRHKIAGDFDLQDLEWSIQNHRQEKAYKRCIFISLSRWSPDLKLDIDDESEVEFSDSSNDGTHPFVFKEPPSEPMEQDIHADTPEDWSNETAAPKIPSSSITDLYRLTLNISQPKGGEAWWPTLKTDPYLRAFDILPGILRLLDRLNASTGEAAWSPALVFDLAADDLFPELGFLVGFGDPEDTDYDSKFTHYFRLGPNGLQPFINFLHRLYNATVHWTPRLSDRELDRCIAIIDRFATPIHNGVLHLRTSIARSVYDPPGFAELHDALAKHRHKLGEADYSDRLVVLDLRVGHDGVPAFATSLEADFGSTTSARAIRPSSLLVGPHGIDGFVEKIVIPLLDSMSPDNASYSPLRTLLGTFCNELATKLVNHSKTQGKRNALMQLIRLISAMVEAAADMRLVAKTVDRPLKARDGSSNSNETQDEETDSDHDTLFSGSSVHEFEPTEADHEKFARAAENRETPQSSSYHPRPRFPYPETRPQQECPYDRPAAATPPPSTPRPKPRPAYTGSGRKAKPSASTSAAQVVADDELTGAEYLANISNRRDLVEKIVKDFPHPAPERRLLWESISHRPSNRRLWHTVVFVYHPDKNIDMPEEWQRKCAVITQILNNKFN
ncbi:hypothetical protein B0H14DRAFT_3554849 [Mycena olivaceomarginata]|nr:hypothetical protein B0H14DRAFT_3554849 [Mycena olivaceomarginata]